MANRRMFSKDIVESDRFLAMPLTSHALYMHLCMEADDDGFVGSPKKIMRAIGSNEDDIKVLISKGYVLTLDEGIIVVSHWHMNNQIRKDRYKETIYITQKKCLVLTNNIYQIKCKKKDNQLTTNCQPNDNQMANQFSLGQVSKEEINVVVSSKIDDIIKKYGFNYNEELKLFGTAELNESIEQFKVFVCKCLSNEEIKKFIDLSLGESFELFDAYKKTMHKDNPANERFLNVHSPEGFVISLLREKMKEEE